MRLSRVLGGDCNDRRSWGIDPDFIWVNNGCRAEFRVGGGNDSGNNSGGLSTGAVIAGAAVAAGLLALLLSRNKKQDGQAPDTTDTTQTGNRPPAAIDIGQNLVPPAAEQAFRRCIDEAARQVGSSGGTRLRLTGDVQHRQFEGAWQFRLPLESTWQSGAQATPAECTATQAAVRKLDFLATSNGG